MTITFGDRTVRPEDVGFCLVSNGRQLGIYLFFGGYHENERQTWGQIDYLLLDQALGEYDVETKVGPIQFFPSTAHPNAVRYALTVGDQLPERLNPTVSECRSLPIVGVVDPEAAVRRLAWQRW